MTELKAWHQCLSCGSWWETSVSVEKYEDEELSKLKLRGCPICT